MRASVVPLGGRHGRERASAWVTMNEPNDEKRRPDEPLPVTETTPDATGNPVGQKPISPDQRERVLPGGPKQPPQSDEKQGNTGPQS